MSVLPALSSSRGADDERELLAEFLSAGSLDDLIPRIARDRKAMQRIEAVVRGLNTGHELIHGDARTASALPPNSVHLVVTSPPYWTLKRYHEHAQQLGHVADYEEFNNALAEVWSNCYRALVPGGPSHAGRRVCARAARVADSETFEGSLA